MKKYLVVLFAFVMLSLINSCSSDKSTPEELSKEIMNSIRNNDVNLMMSLAVVWEDYIQEVELYRKRKGSKLTEENKKSERKSYDYSIKKMEGEVSIFFSNLEKSSINLRNCELISLDYKIRNDGGAKEIDPLLLIFKDGDNVYKLSLDYMYCNKHWYISKFSSNIKVKKEVWESVILQKKDMERSDNVENSDYREDELKVKIDQQKESNEFLKNKDTFEREKKAREQGMVKEGEKIYKYKVE